MPATKKKAKRRTDPSNGAQSPEPERYVLELDASLALTAWELTEACGGRAEVVDAMGALRRLLRAGITFGEDDRAESAQGGEFELTRMQVVQLWAISEGIGATGGRQVDALFSFREAIRPLWAKAEPLFLAEIEAKRQAVEGVR